jgi:uncharacterized protein with HEPN domain
MPPSSVAPYLTDIIEAIEHVREKAGTTPLEQFKQDWEQQWIVQRGIEIVSEASRRLPDTMKARYPDIPWPKIAAVGNILRHEYRQISPPLLWEIVQDHLAPLDAACRIELAREQAAEQDDRPDPLPRRGEGVH